jgi:hypothetical protein
MDCQIILDSLSNYLDGLLLESEVRLIEGHLSQCPPCNSVKLELAEIRQAARELPLHTPSRALWGRIQSCIEAERTGKRQVARLTERTSWWSQLMARRFTFTFPQLVGASAVAIIFFAFGVVGVYHQSQNPGSSSVPVVNQISANIVLPGEEKLKAEIERRMSMLNLRKASWDPQMREMFETHLAKIDQSLEHCRQNLLANPSDQDSQQRVLDLYQEKAQLLEDFAKLK